MEEVNKSGWSRPNFSNIGFLSISLHNVNSSLQSFLIGTSTCLNSCINNGNVSIFLKYLVHPIKRESVLINSEIFIIDHIVNISPNCIKRKSILFKIRNYLLKYRNIVISPSTLMEPKSPEWRNLSSTIISIQSLDCSLWILFSQEESKIEDTTNNFKGDIVLIIFS
jgi:hypothetical protein